MIDGRYFVLINSQLVDALNFPEAACFLVSLSCRNYSRTRHVLQRSDKLIRIAAERV